MIPSGIRLRKQSRCLALSYGDDGYELSYEFLRVFSPSAEVRGHGVGNEVLQYGKKDVGIVRIEPAGNYALKLIFDDGHDSGLYDWKYLHHLCLNQESLWQDYLQKLEAAGQSRESATINFRSL
ncbi:MAG: 1-(5-phosphoribosyl)-5-((5-phosphoribosylamino)methylideneamino)imidazole-4-carboxamide isomerase [Oceanospirillaceae bacterium]|nr:1-(5-phosphoribosyl)-5-((5-phosphoribosylamino)methylideneamino)imidazole-4-carboxamide isomerase [Oceanospirillaceae bacterium]|tara:strand:- start:17640 stop:18011 length:372 start_codon:yes stop_codon:yes gene_type:complete